MHAIGFTSSLTPPRALPLRRVPLSAHSSLSSAPDSFRRLRFGKDADQEVTGSSEESSFGILFQGRKNQQIRRFLRRRDIHTFDDFETQIVQLNSKDVEDWYRVASVIRHGYSPSKN